MEDGRELAFEAHGARAEALLASFEQVEKPMTKEKEVTLEIRQAESADAALVIDFLNQVGKESDYMTLDETGIGMTLADMEHFLMVQEMSDNRICLLLFLDQELVALLNITAASKRSTQHIGDVFIVVQKLIGIKGLDRSCWKKELSGHTRPVFFGN